MPFRPVLALTLALGLVLSACAPTAPPPAPPTPAPAPDSAAVPEPAPEPIPVPEPPPPEPEPEAEPEPEPEEPDPLYEQTEDDLLVAFADGLFGLYRAEVNPADAERLGRAEIAAWLTDLALVSPRAVEFARRQLGPVLDQRYVVGFLLRNAAQAECASVRGVLYVPVPERFQGPDRPFTGYLIQDACDLGSDDLAPFCSGGFGTTDDGAACSCTCTAGEAPGLGCVTC